MKKEFYFALFAVLVALLFYCTKPSDERCIAMTRQAMMQHQASDNILGVLEGTVMYNKYTVAVEDDFFYKKVYSHYDGHILAIAILGQIILR